MLLQSQHISLIRQGGLELTFPNIKISTQSSALLLGASGAGKTTLISILAGLLEPTSGQVFLNGQDFYALNQKEKDALRCEYFGFIFQTLHLLPSLTAKQNIILAASMAKRSYDQGYFQHIIQTLKINNKMNNKPHQLSQGEQQRVAVARALLLRPKIILADEPTSALDDLNASAVVDLLKECAEQANASLLIATHDNRIKDQFDHIIHLQSAQDCEAT